LQVVLENYKAYLLINRVVVAIQADYYLCRTPVLYLVKYSAWYASYKEFYFLM
jgi:hypothetical protein